MGVELVSFWDLPDIDKTAEETEKFLLKYPDLLEMRAGRKVTDLSSPLMDITGVHSRGRNNQEENTVRGAEALEHLEAIRETIDKLPLVSKELLYYRYLKHEPVQKVRNQRIYMDHNSYTVAKKTALNQFADIWEITQEKYGWDEDDCKHLQVFKN